MASQLLSLARRDGSNPPMSQTIFDLLTVLLVLVIVGLLLVAALFFLRRRKRAQRAAAIAEITPVLPAYSEKHTSVASVSSNHRRVTARPSQTVVYNEKEVLVGTSSDPTSSTDSLPEIRVTFPEEVDAAGKRQSGKVVVVRVGDTGVGLEPVSEHPPPYQRSEGERFQSVDLERVGGLIDSARNAPSRS